MKKDVFLPWQGQTQRHSYRRKVKQTKEAIKKVCLLHVVMVRRSAAQTLHVVATVGDGFVLPAGVMTERIPVSSELLRWFLGRGLL